MVEVSFDSAAITWPEPEQGWSPAPVQIQVWAFSLDIAPEPLRACAATLSPVEAARAARFHFERHRARFIAGRGKLRAILGWYLDVEPEEVEFQYGAHGKPALTGAWGQTGLEFNLAHTGGLALLAVGREVALGVDVEHVRALTEFDALVARFFSERESAAFQALATSQKPDAFFNLWTRKEAWLKATGKGIGELLNQVEVSFLPGEPARLKRLPAGLDSKERWQLIDLRPAADYAGAAAFAGESAPVQCWRWPEPRGQAG